MISALGMSRGSSAGRGGDRLAKFVAGKRLTSFISPELLDVTKNPIKFNGSLRKKLLKAKTFVDEVYILPFGEDIPYQWTENMIVCNNCGHQIGKTSHNG